MMMSNAVKGFTLLELLMVLTLAAIILTFAVPSFQTFTQNARLTKQVNMLASSMASARGEAAKRGMRVVVCQSTNPSSTTPACDGTTGSWSTGWVVFLDSNNNLTVDAATDVVGFFRTETGVNIKVNASKTTKTIAFNPDGSTTESNEINFALCDSRGKEFGKQLDVATTGRVELKGKTGSGIDTCSPA